MGGTALSNRFVLFWHNQSVGWNGATALPDLFVLNLHSMVKDGFHVQVWAYQTLKMSVPGVEQLLESNCCRVCA